jgi:hypothetical protein
LFYSRERFIYYFDLGGFEGIVNELAPLFPDNWKTLLRWLVSSLSTDYNYYYTLPLIPLVRFLGANRENYLVGVTLFYQIPFTLALGYLFLQLAPHRKRLVYWIAVVSAMLIPNTWSPTLRGYPDIVGTLFICLAMGLYLYNDPNQRWWQYLLTGFCLGWSAIFRRYNLYGDIAFYFVSAILIFIELIGHKRWLDFIKKGLWLFLSALSFLLTLYLFNKPFLLNIFTTNYYALYSSYLQGASAELTYFISQYGRLIWLFALLGYLAGFLFKQANRKQLLFVFLWGLILLVTWVFYVRQVGIHYTLSITIFIAIGIASLFETMLTRLKKRPQMVGIGLLSLFLVVNFLYTFTYIQLPVAAKAMKPYFSTLVPPFFRQDYSEVMRLVDTMRALTPNREAIYVVDSSWVMNYDILKKAEQQQYQQDARLNLSLTPQIDSRDTYPLELLLLADFVVVSTPLQLHAQKGSQRVVEYVHDAFQNQWDITKDFVELPVQFQLGVNDVTTRVYQRIHPTDLCTALATLKQIQAYLPQRPGSQKDWILLTNLYSTGILPGQARQYLFHLDPIFLANETTIQILYIGNVPKQGRLIVELKYPDENMPALVFDLFGYDDLQKKRFPLAQETWAYNDSPVISVPYSIDTVTNTDQLYLVFQIKKQTGENRDLPGRIIVEFSLLSE